MTTLNDRSVADLLDLYKRLEAHVSVNDEPLFILTYHKKEGWSADMNAEGDDLDLTEAEAKLLLFFTGRECSEAILIHLYSVAGHFRNAIKSKLDDAIPEPPQKWYRYINAFRTNWTPEEKEFKPKKEVKPKKGEIIRLGSKINESPVPFPKSSKDDEPPF